MILSSNQCHMHATLILLLRECHVRVDRLQSNPDPEIGTIVRFVMWVGSLKICSTLSAALGV